METADVDFDAYYRVEGCCGIAFFLERWDQHYVWDVDDQGFEYEEWIDSDDTVIAIMVGDDREHVVDISQLTKIDREDFCIGCGQIGCDHDGLERE